MAESETEERGGGEGELGPRRDIDKDGTKVAPNYLRDRA